MAQLQFKGKQFVQNHHLVVPYHELVPRKAKSLTDKVSLHDNLIVHGDNLAALKALLPTYAGKVKCIYIDPPYNTGNERWAYNDNVNSPMMQEWLGKVVDREDLTRHDKWLCMMTPRLKLLRELLRDDGVIFVSIDDNEVHNLRLLMDEVFGEVNFISCIAVYSNPRGRQSTSNVAPTHEYLLLYSKTEKGEIKGEPLTSEQRREYSLRDKKGDYREVGLRLRGGRATARESPSLHFSLYVNPDDSTISLEKENGFVEIRPMFENGIPGTWRWSEVKIAQELDKLVARIVRGRRGPRWDIFEKDYLREGTTRKVKSVWFGRDINYDIGADEMGKIFEEKKFEHAKPTTLIRRIVNIATERDSLVLDSFAGSGTTAHAVLALNKEDGGNRKFILVEMEDYADKITAERVRRVIKGVPKAKDEQLRAGLGGTFSYFELGKPIEMESLLEGKNLPTYKELARYVFYTATGEEFDEKAVDEKRHFIGESAEYEVYLFYKPDVEYLRNTALTLERARALGPVRSKRRLVFAPTKYLDQDMLDELRVDFAQLPFEIYQLAA